MPWKSASGLPSGKAIDCPSYGYSSPSLLRSMFCPFPGSFLFLVGAGVLLVVAIPSIAALVHMTGGTKTAYPYLILLPVILAGFVFKVGGGLLAAVVAALFLGPGMPLDVENGTMQTTSNWLVRMGMYIVIGVFVGVLSGGYAYAQDRLLAREKIDDASGLISVVSVRKMMAGEDALSQLGYEPATAVAIEFEGFDAIVLAMGNNVGGQVLQRLGSALKDVVENKFLTTRISNATFGAVLPPGNEPIQDFISRCQKEFSRSIEVDGIPMTVLPRYGVCTALSDDLQRSVPFRRALVALRHAQHAGQNVVRFADIQDVNAQENLSLLSLFRRDLERGVCEVHYQPKQTLGTDKVFGAEALIRWRNEDLGNISPARFVPLVENTQLIADLTWFVVKRAVETAADWHQKDLDLKVAINLSTRNLEDRNLLEFLLSLPEKYDVPANRIEFEITESALMHDRASTGGALAKLRDVGFSLAIDDFGTGFSSLSYLKEMPVQWVKLDQSFVRDLPDNKASQEIAHTAASICHWLGFNIVAEGVETADAKRILLEYGFDAIQGYHLSKAMPQVEFEEWMLGRTNEVTIPT